MPQMHAAGMKGDGVCCNGLMGIGACLISRLALQHLFFLFSSRCEMVGLFLIRRLSHTISRIL
jgi:hypothetical protein